LQEMRGDQWASIPAGRVAGLIHLSFAVDDLDQEVKRWGTAGLMLMVAPMQPGLMISSEEHWRRAVFEGPDGEKIELRGP
jgi:lactoylglutathione lyase